MNQQNNYAMNTLNVQNNSFHRDSLLPVDWTSFLGNTGDDIARAVTVGSDGGIYVSGYTSGNLDGLTNSGALDAFITKYNSNGSKAWTRTLGTIGFDRANALTTGVDGSVYLAGNTGGSLDGQTNTGNMDAFVTKYNPDGIKAWTRLVGSTGNDYAFALTTGADGSIYVAGITDGNLDAQGNRGNTDAFLTKYSSNGDQAWTKVFGTTGNDYAYALTTGNDGNIYVAGITNGNLDGQPNRGSGDAFITKYTSTGLREWTRLVGSTSSDSAYTLTTDTKGSIYIGGFTYGDLDGKSSSGNGDAFITKYEPDGAKVWTELFGTSSSDSAYGLTTGDQGSIYVTGTTYGNIDNPNNNGDIFISKLVVDGSIIYANRQEITYGGNVGAYPSLDASIPLFYSTSTNDNTLAGIGLRLHYDSSELTFKNVTNFYQNGLFGTITPIPDTQNFDNDPRTDTYISFQYFDSDGRWPGESLPLKLGEFNFGTNISFAGTQVNITSDDLAPNYSLRADSIFVDKREWNLDIDGNGRIEALTDGIMVVRYMFGIPFAGDKLSAGAVANDATRRNLAEIQAYLQEGIDIGYLDIDRNGEVKALSDGMMVVRHMLGAFPGSRLIEGILPQNASRDLAQIQEHLAYLSDLS